MPAAGGRVRLPQGRLVMPRRRIFCTQVVLDHYQTGPSRKYRVIDGILVEQGAWRRQFVRHGVNRPGESNRRRRVGVNPAADRSAVMSEPAELAAGRPRARCAGAGTAHARPHSRRGFGSRVSRSLPLAHTTCAASRAADTPQERVPGLIYGHSRP